MGEELKIISKNIEQFRNSFVKTKNKKTLIALKDYVNQNEILIKRDKLYYNLLILILYNEYFELEKSKLFSDNIILRNIEEMLLMLNENLYSKYNSESILKIFNIMEVSNHYLGSHLEVYNVTMKKLEYMKKHCNVKTVEDTKVHATQYVKKYFESIKKQSKANIGYTELIKRIDCM